MKKILTALGFVVVALIGLAVWLSPSRQPAPPGPPPVPPPPWLLPALYGAWNLALLFWLCLAVFAWGHSAWWLLLLAWLWKPLSPKK